MKAGFSPIFFWARGCCCTWILLKFWIIYMFTWICSSHAPPPLESPNSGFKRKPLVCHSGKESVAYFTSRWVRCAGGKSHSDESWCVLAWQRGFLI